MSPTANGASYSVTQKSTNDALLFGFPKPGSKQKIRLEVCESEWSKLFSIDAAGSGGNIKCKKDDQFYEIGLQVRLTRSGLSRIVTFLPYQTVVNKTNEKVIMYDDGKTEDVEAGEWIPYWTKGRSGLMSLKLGSESEPESCKFAFNKAQSTLLKLEGTVRGVHVQVEISDSSSIITFMPYFVGSSPVRVENRLREDIPVTVFQRDEESAGVCVNSGTSQMFTWSNPNGKRVFCWKFHSFSERLFCNDLKQVRISPLRYSSSAIIFFV
ncbi:intermembrane lipid transfer protein VPS13C-like [Oscarella lobularis]|uniref:intermembrane lipid transfer protein VPS13C-like n=1 Tax=Oscarella lobularis TaxID=121494 RepID=UPI003313C778